MNEAQQPYTHTCTHAHAHAIQGACGGIGLGVAFGHAAGRQIAFIPVGGRLDLFALTAIGAFETWEALGNLWKANLPHLEIAVAELAWRFWTPLWQKVRHC